MDQYSYNEHRLEHCVCGADFEPRPCTCGFYPESKKQTKEAEQYGKSKYLRCSKGSTERS